jgi:hemerythrin-like domain-containing protein
MLRDKNFIPLSHQHQHALALCVRIERASPVAASDLEGWQAEIAVTFQSEIKIHFAAEEQVLFPAALRFPQLKPLVEDLLREHATLRREFVDAEQRTMPAEQLLNFARILAAHIRKEERQLFEQMQHLLKVDELANLGALLERALRDAAQVCAVRRQSSRE